MLISRHQLVTKIVATAALVLACALCVDVACGQGNDWTSLPVLGSPTQPQQVAPAPPQMMPPAMAPTMAYSTAWPATATPPAPPLMPVPAYGGYGGVGGYSPMLAPAYPYTMDPNTAILNQYAYQQAAQQQQQSLTQQQQILMAALIEREADRLAAEDDAAAEEQKSSNAWSMGNLAPVKVSSPLLDSMWVGAGYMNPFNATDKADRGVGCPLQLQCWIDRPYYAGGYVGWSSGGTLVKKYIKQDSGGTFGLILGKQYSHYWGFEGRLHFASLAERLTDEGALLPAANLIEGQANHITMADISAHYYPLGNSRWRPFFKWGVGVAGESFVGIDGVRRTNTSGLMPIGMGLKYWWNERFSLSTDLIDNIVFGTGGVATQHNFAFSFGLVYAFGKNKTSRPTAYWPYTPSTKR
ncbi:MAG: outer membrane beta-barrel protein [Thermoguttaceae bacterium]